MKPFAALVYLCLCFLNVTGSAIETDEDNELIELKENAENVCIDQRVQNQIINVTFIQSQDVKDYTWCVKIPPRCVVYRTKLVTRYREENVTRVVNIRSCCPGYEPDGQGYCKAVCQESCGSHGVCSEPDVCRCDPGFSGQTCQEIGCPGGNWGPDCSKVCPCQNGGRCEPHTGRCLCSPGYTGSNCENQCDSNTFGMDCSEKCACSVGQRCHHVSGECLPCTPGTYGPQCAKKCQCSQNGTALCLHTTGQCFCSPNWYGDTCQLHCPFGFVDDECHTSPIDPQVCICSSDQMTCDHVQGCICKKGGDCGGGQRLLDLTRAAPLDQFDQDGSSSHSQTVAIVLSVVFLTLVTVIMVIIYYRRRMKRLQKDLQNRSVYYVENSILDPGRHAGQHDMVITDRDPVEIQPDPLIHTVFSSNHQVVNNLNNSAASKHVKAEKNVNIDRFKLGFEESTADESAVADPSSCCGSAAADQLASEQLGACAMSVEDPMPPTPSDESVAGSRKNYDINVFEDDSPSHEKNNFLLDNARKINKANVDLVFHKNN